MALAIVVLVVWATLVVAWIAAIVSASASPSGAYEAVGRSRRGTVLLIVLTGWLGAGYYWLSIRRELASSD